jgi:dihydroorotase
MYRFLSKYEIRKQPLSSHNSFTMKLLIKQATIADPQSSFHRSRKDIFIENGIIKAIADRIDQPADETISVQGLSVSPGWMDCFSHFCDPGYEHRETLASGAEAAARGGFTTVFTLPNTKPVVDSKAPVEYVLQQSKYLPAAIIPIGAITKNAEGKELAEMYDMHNSGAIAFSDGLHPLQSAGILLKALQYVRAFDGVIIQVPIDKSIAPHGLMHEGIVSTRLGLPGSPVMAEELIVARDIKLARYAESKLHFTGVSSKKSLEYIQRAKDGGLTITCSVTPHHLAFCDEDLMSYDTNLKVNPPLRSREDMLYLRKAVADGLVDCIATHHLPQDWDSKTCEFEYAKPGMIGLQTCYSVLKTVIPELGDDQLVQLLSIAPRRIFGLNPSIIAEGAAADLSLFIPEASFTLKKEMLASKSYNSPFLDKELRGQVIGTINGNKKSLYGI